MKRSRRQGSPRILKTDLPSLFLSWLKGAWGSLRRFVMRLLRPNRGRRNYIELQPEKPHVCPLVGVEDLNYGALTVSDLMGKVQWNPPVAFSDTIAVAQNGRSTSQPKKPHILPLLGVEKLGKVESLTVDDLIGKVRWNPSGQPETTLDPIPVVAKARSGDRISPLVGIDQIDYVETVSVSDLMETVLWRFPGRVVEKIADFSTDSSDSNVAVAPVEELFSAKEPIRPLICPLMGLEELSLSETLTVGSLMASVQWITIKKAAKSSPKTSSDSDFTVIQDEINWD
jgi:hypothetical protein